MNKIIITISLLLLMPMIVEAKVVSGTYDVKSCFLPASTAIPLNMQDCAVQGGAITKSAIQFSVDGTASAIVPFVAIDFALTPTAQSKKALGIWRHDRSKVSFYLKHFIKSGKNAFAHQSFNGTLTFTGHDMMEGGLEVFQYCFNDGDSIGKCQSEIPSIPLSNTLIGTGYIVLERMQF